MDWCNNHITVRGSADDMSVFLSRVTTSQTFTIDGVATYPLTQLDTWTSQEGVVVFDGVFTTEDDPPVTGVALYSKHFPQLSFQLESNDLGEDGVTRFDISSGHINDLGFQSQSMYCGDCNKYSYRLSRCDGSLRSLCELCFLSREGTRATGELLITSKHVEPISGTLRDHPTLLSLFGSRKTEADMLNHSSGNTGTSPNPFLNALHETHTPPLRMEVEATEGGSVLVRYDTFIHDDGALLWSAMSAQNPEATFYLTVTPSSGNSTFFALSQGALVMECNNK